MSGDRTGARHPRKQERGNRSACQLFCLMHAWWFALIRSWWFVWLNTHRTEAVTSLCIISCNSNCRPQAVRDHTRSDSSRTRTPSMSTILYQTHSQRDRSPLLTNIPKMPNSAYALVPHSNYFSLYATSCNEKDSPSRCTPREAMPQEPTSTCLCYEHTKAEQGWSPNQFASGLAQIWFRYGPDMAQHPFPSPTPFSFTNTLFTYITSFPCHKHIPFRPSAASEHYINRSFCTNLLLYS